MAPPPPFRVAIIGLSASAVTSWAPEAHLPALQTAAGRERYRIVALCNSSEAAARASIATYGLPADTKAYGSPAELAADPDVDFVICSTRVDKHLETALPSVRAGKDVFVEWPVASNTADVDALAAAARQSGARVLVGLQGRWAPPVLKLRELLAAGAIGRLLSCEVRAYGGTNDRELLPVGLKYFAQRAAGGNPITIGFGHVIDFVQSVVGELVPGTVHTHFQLQRPEVRIRDPARNNQIVETIRSDVPDLLSLHGFVIPAVGPTTAGTGNASPATLTVLFRRGQPFPGTPALTWTLHGTAGELRLVAPGGIALQADAGYAGAEPVRIALHRFGNQPGGGEGEVVEDVPWSVLFAWADYRRGLVGEEGREKGWVELEEAAERARQIQGWLDGWQA
ncbi:fc8ca640-7c5f-46e2-a4a9-268dcf486eb1 [Thermothielavioides terrestris]|uniref:Fc8ca640-7c5f-46e2-a4a9-268dcf486eb1 n=1 Tax=Thermothielavioides terrestris TaxID=2587410 RepID=A0A446BP28_9PEZI|nr:fc8ca640-7c5f-46e2-a4a9-268dcf486eb1 [Thermothielavioides terrestris]